MLARELENYQGSNALVLAIPRGGVVVGYEIARLLNLPLDVVIPRKIGAPGQPELAIGAVAAEDGTALILDENAVRMLHVSEDFIRQETQKEAAEIRRRSTLYREGRPAPEIADRRVILVDDGVATGYTTRAAIRSLKNKGPKEIVLAVPVAPPEIIQRLKQEVDQLICPNQPELFFAVGAWYRQFPQLSDDEVLDLLREARRQQTAQASMTSI
jgi:predicted phosphoribosyltransferase